MVSHSCQTWVHAKTCFMESPNTQPNTEVGLINIEFSYLKQTRKG